MSVPQRPRCNAEASTAMRLCAAGKLIRHQRKETRSMASGNGANGATHESPLPAVIATIAASDNGHGALSSPAQLQNIRELLCEPFDPSDIKWRVTATS